MNTVTYVRWVTRWNNYENRTESNILIAMSDQKSLYFVAKWNPVTL